MLFLLMGSKNTSRLLFIILELYFFDLAAKLNEIIVK
jgi:hypothetical protein